MYRHLFESQKNNRKKPALHFVGRDITYGQLFNEVEALCCAFRKYGCKKGDIVTIALPNIPSAVTLFYAVNKLGMTANLVHPLLPAEQIIRYATETKSKFLSCLTSWRTDTSPNCWIVPCPLGFVRHRITSRRLKECFTISLPGGTEKICEKTAPIISNSNISVTRARGCQNT